MAPRSATQQREQKVVATGAAIVIVALLAVYVVIPFARHWTARAELLREAQTNVATLAGLVQAAPAFENAATRAEAALAVNPSRIFHARSAPLAASALQSLLQDAANASHLLVTRLDVAQSLATRPTQSFGATALGATALGATALGATAPGGPAPADSASSLNASLPATLAAYCDIIGLAALLDHLAHAPRVVRVEKLTIQQNSALRGAPDMLQITLTLRAPVVLE